MGIIGCLCFAVGDWLLGYVDPTPAGENIFYFIREGHGIGYNTSRSAAAAAISAVGMFFLYPGFARISDIAKNEKTRLSLEYLLGLCSAGWLTIHLTVAVNVFVFSQAEKIGGRELAAEFSNSLGNASLLTLGFAYLFAAAAFMKLIFDILRRKTYMKRTAAFFTPIVPMAVIWAVSLTLPSSAFSYGLYTFCMNGGMLVWFLYLLAVNGKYTNKQ